MLEISSEISIEELVDKYPEAIEFLTRRGIVCIVCGEPAWGTLREVAFRKGITDVEKLVDELAEFIEKRKSCK